MNRVIKPEVISFGEKEMRFIFVAKEGKELPNISEVENILNESLPPHVGIKVFA